MVDEEEAEKKSRATVDLRPEGGPQKGAEWRQLVATHIPASSAPSSVNTRKNAYILHNYAKKAGGGSDDTCECV